MQRPDPNESATFYHGYVDGVPDGDILEILACQFDDTAAVLAAVDEDRAGHRYAPGKWSIAQVVGHMIDVERVFAYRALHFARGDRHPLPGFEQDDYVATGKFDARRLSSLVDEFRAVRAATLTLLRSFDQDDWCRTGVASDCPFTVRSVAYIVAGHERHHRAILCERYRCTSS